MTERAFNLVVPLPHTGTDMRTSDTAGITRAASGAVSPLNNRQGDVESTMVTPGTRTSTTATRTTTTRTPSSALVPSADRNATADFTFTELAEAYFDCRRTKRNSASALAFEVNLERNLRRLYDDLKSGEYTPGRSICFVITRPRPREVWAAEFRDRVVHHLLHNRIAPRFYARFIADSCACIPERELFTAQGFPAGYVIDHGFNEHGQRITLTKTAQVRMCGNSVCPPLSKAIVEANFTHEMAWRHKESA